MSGYLNGSDGEKSSKRLMGIISFSCGIAVYVGLGVTGMFREIPDLEAVRSAAFGLSSIGAGLLGVGVIEKFAKPKPNGDE